jgi:hypothetical protein
MTYHRGSNFLGHCLVGLSSLGIIVIYLEVLTGCGAAKKVAKDLEDSLFAEASYEPVPGDDVVNFLLTVPGAPPVDTKAAQAALNIGAKESSDEQLKLLGLTVAEGDISEVESGTVDYMTATAPNKIVFDSGKFKLPKIDSLVNEKKPSGNKLNLMANEWDGLPKKERTFNAKTDQVNLSDGAWNGKTEILISNLHRVPIKNQGSRGTCASFTGIAGLEYLILKKHGQDLQGVDLSEQRFYMLSRSDLWPHGGQVDTDGGSAWENGYRISFGDGGGAPPTDKSPYNIPIEEDCPYVSQPGPNELQIPQGTPCKRGAVKVKGLTRTYDISWSDGTKELRSNSVRSAQEIFDYIKTYDLPIPVGTVLTENWQNNDGMITLAKSKKPGFGPHAGGHAYLIVGMRKLSEAEFPGEGGMCFVIRNSWGTGWGANGFSCMTLAWFNEYRDGGSFDYVTDVDVDLSYLKSKFQPAGGIPSAPQGPVSPPAPTPEPPPAVVPVANPGEPPPQPAPIVAADIPAPAPTPGVTGDGYSLGRLVSRDGTLLRVQYKVDGAKFNIRGQHPDTSKVTQALDLIFENNGIQFNDDSRKRKNVKVGEISGDLIYLCSGKYALTCHLNYLKDTNQLVMGVAEAEFRRYEADPDADYTSLLNLGNYGIEYHKAEGIFTDLRFLIKGQKTNPLRFAVKPVSGDILMMGKAIGNYQKAAFCSGDYSKICRVVYDKKKNNINVFFKSKS